MYESTNVKEQAHANEKYTTGIISPKPKTRYADVSKPIELANQRVVFPKERTQIPGK